MHRMLLIYTPILILFVLGQGGIMVLGFSYK